MKMAHQMVSWTTEDSGMAAARRRSPSSRTSGRCWEPPLRREPQLSRRGTAELLREPWLVNRLPALPLPKALQPLPFKTAASLRGVHSVCSAALGAGDSCTGDDICGARGGNPVGRVVDWVRELRRAAGRSASLSMLRPSDDTDRAPLLSIEWPGRCTCCLGSSGSSLKHTTTTLTLSPLFRSNAYCTSSAAHCSALLCCRSLAAAKFTAAWLEDTSQSPSQAKSRNSSAAVMRCSRTSGAAVSGPPKLPSLQTFRLSRW
mmetsp:Transcript_20134/g.60768  ORF Transcript_20134/g.60768 Transcript_20134/m.60768 type:complete len:260 (+) Transcript_20134:998-1777(+)